MYRLAFLLITLGAWGQVLSQTPGPTASNGVTLRIYVKPEGPRLHVLARAPLAALNGVVLPYRAVNGELDLARLDAMLPGLARWSIADRLDVFEGETLLSKPEISAARVSLPADGAFASYNDAWRHLFSSKLAEDIQIFREQAMVDVALDYAIRSASSPFSLRPALGQLASSVTTVLEFQPPDSSKNAAARTYEYTGDPGRFFLDPTVGQVFRRFILTGILQILNGTDVLLFLFCVALGLPRMRELFSFAAIFAGAQSLTLLAAAYGFTMDALWFPIFIEALAALAILYLAFEIMADKALIRPRWAVAIVFGFIFGYGFSFGLNPQRQFAGAHALASVLAFDVGLEAGIFPVLAIFAGALLAFSRITRGRLKGRTETIVLSVLAADLAWHRLTGRVERLRQFTFRWPQDAAPGALGWAAIVLATAGAALITFALLEQRRTRLDNHAIYAPFFTGHAGP